MALGSELDESVTLPHEASSAGRARRTVADLVTPIEPDLAELGVLLVSELVTNAILHAGTSIGLRVRGTTGWLRVEVSDGSTRQPHICDYSADATTGRGLDLVEALATGWGTETTANGKVVWFEVGTHPDARTEASGRPGRSAAGTFPVVLREAPVHLLPVTLESGDALMREVSLLSIAGKLGEVAADNWHESALDISPFLEAAAGAAERGLHSTDLHLDLPTGAGDAALERLERLVVAQHLASSGHLLARPALPEVVSCRSWLLQEVNAQEQGRAPKPWTLPGPTAPVSRRARLGPEEVARLDRSTVATVVADDANRIIMLNGAARRLLGWEGGRLAGHRLTVIIPPELRQAHLAGYARHQLTGEGPLIGRATQVPALRRNGTRVEVEISITTWPTSEGETYYRAELRAVTGEDAPNSPP